MKKLLILIVIVITLVSNVFAAEETANQEDLELTRMVNTYFNTIDEIQNIKNFLKDNNNATTDNLKLILKEIDLMIIEYDAIFKSYMNRESSSDDIQLNIENQTYYLTIEDIRDLKNGIKSFREKIQEME